MINSNKKKREEEILIGHKEKYNQIILKGDGEISIRLLSGEIVKPDSVKSSLRHQKNSGKDKVITRLSEQATFDTLDFLKKYESVFFIDTNTKIIHGKKISIASIIEVRNFKIKDVKVEKKVRVSMERSNPWYLIFENETKIHSEKIAIALLIYKLKKNPNYPECVGIISDHELEKHAQYSKQELPLFDSFYLPKGYEIAYASADKKNDTILNKFIAECDKCSSQLLDNFTINNKIIVDGKEIFLEKISKIIKKLNKKEAS